MANSYYNHGSFPATGSAATSASMRAELELITTGFDKLPTLSGNQNKLVVVNSTGTALDTTSVLPALEVIDGDFVFRDNSDATRKFRFEASSVTAGQTRVLTVPDADTTIVGTDVTQTLTAKTLTTPVLSGTASGTTAGRLGYSAGVFTYGDGTNQRVVVNTNEAQTLTNKTISGSSNTLSNIANSSLTNSSITIGSTTIALGGTSTSLAGLTDVTASGNVTLSGGTANGVLYLNGSKVATSGSALVFDGTNLGIGGSPNALLQVATSTNTIAAALGKPAFTGYQTDAVLNLLGDQADGDGPTICFNHQNVGTASTGKGARIVGYRVNAGFNRYMGIDFKIADSGGTSTQAMRIDQFGNVGIGTTSPGAKLHVSSASDDILRLTATAPYLSFYNGATRTGYIRSNTSGTFAIVSEDASTPMVFYTAGAEAMRISTSGNLGLGVTPSAWGSGIGFQVGYATIFGQNSAGSGAQFMANAFYNGSSYRYISNGYASRMEFAAGGINWNTAPSGTAGNAITFTQAMTLDANGRLMVGTTSASGIIHASAGNGAAFMQLTNSTSGKLLQLENNSSGINFWTDANIPISFYNNNTQRMTIDSTGKLGINTTSPYSKLDVYSTSATELTSVFTTGVSDGNFRIGFMNGSSGGSGTDMGKMGLFYLGTGEAATLSFIRGGGAQDASIAFRTNNTERIRIPSDAGGIKFPATQAASSDANTLDDYEEGTFTPTVRGSSTAGTATYAVQKGKYTKIGNIVTVTAYVAWSGHTGTGNLQLSNLPFTSANEADLYVSVTFGYVQNIGLTASNILTGYINPNTTTANINQTPVGGGAMSAVSMDAAGEFMYSATYFVA